MDLRFSPQDEAFRAEVRRWLEVHLSGSFEALRGRGGPGDEPAGQPGAPDELLELRRSWERLLGRAGWSCIGWPTEHGGRAAPLSQQVLFHEEYARAGAPGRLGYFGQELLGPTLIALGTPAQRARFLPPIVSGDELWCQGYSEPGAGSDLAGVQTRAELRGGEWVVTGQKLWTSAAHLADWCFALCLTDPAAPRHRGLSYLLVPMRQPGITIRPIAQMTGSCEFNEVFFDGARTAAEHIVGPVHGGWRVAMATLGFERGAATLGQQIGFSRELQMIVDLARRSGALRDPLIRDRLVRAACGLRVMRWSSLRSLSSAATPAAASLVKLYWARWHRDLGELAMDVLGAGSLLAHEVSTEAGKLQRLFLFSRADTIYAGSNQIQRNIIAERVLGLPPEPRPAGGAP